LATTERQQTGHKPVVLLVAEAVTLAHFARIVTLAKELDKEAYEIVVASDPRYLNLQEKFDFQFYSLQSIPSAKFAAALARGKPLYDRKTLAQYVEDDLGLIDAFKPDMIVGDFRLSLSVSAPLRKVPYASISNAYWSPYADTVYPVPDLPFTRLLGIRISQIIFDLVKPVAFGLHARPLNVLRRRFGLRPLRYDIRDVYTWGDYTLYADIPEVVPTRNLPEHHKYIGPVLWSTATSLPIWWDELPDDKPVVFLTLGSSGHAKLLPTMIDALGQLPVSIMVATAGMIDAVQLSRPNVYTTDYLPMDLATRRSDLMVSNGGSMSTYQALADGIPILGVCTNMDQLLNMNAVSRLGAGISLRAARTNLQEIQMAASRLLNDPSYKQAAQTTSETLKRYDSGKRFRAFIEEALGQ
jgi:UDP:flavonoid glycosyltransferase YjiC (YdhE family)